MTYARRKAEFSNPEHDLPSVLRSLVKCSVAALGEVISTEAGRPAFRRVEGIRKAMAGLRGRSPQIASRTLHRLLTEFEGLRSEDREVIARSFTLMMELINACENAYRTHRIRLEAKEDKGKKGPESIIYVFTAHPTEARSPENVEVFHELQQLLVESLEKDWEKVRTRIEHALKLSWRISIARQSKPEVADEAAALYSIALRDEVLELLIERSFGSSPLYFRDLGRWRQRRSSWCGPPRYES